MWGSGPDLGVEGLRPNVARVRLLDKQGVCSSGIDDERIRSNVQVDVTRNRAGNFLLTRHNIVCSREY